MTRYTVEPFPRSSTCFWVRDTQSNCTVFSKALYMQPAKNQRYCEAVAETLNRLESEEDAV
jgi:hypothetical protein